MKCGYVRQGVMMTGREGGDATLTDGLTLQDRCGAVRPDPPTEINLLRLERGFAPSTPPPGLRPTRAT